MRDRHHQHLDITFEATCCDWRLTLAYRPGLAHNLPNHRRRFVGGRGRGRTLKCLDDESAQTPHRKAGSTCWRAAIDVVVVCDM